MSDPVLTVQTYWCLDSNDICVPYICICGGQRSTLSVIPQELVTWFHETGSFTWTRLGWPVSLKGTSLSTSPVMELQINFTTASFACEGAGSLSQMCVPATRDCSKRVKENRV